MEKEIKILKDKGLTWSQVAETMNISVSSARRYYKKNPEFPKMHEGTIYRAVINPRLMLIQLKDEVVPAVIRPGNYRQGTKVNVEQIDKSHYRVV